MSNAETVLSAFHDAQASGATIDWQAMAAALAAAIPAPKRRKADPNAAPAWWVSYPLPRAFIVASCAVTFADGQEIKSNASRVAGKPWRIEDATRGAIAYWRARNRTDGAVPAIVSLVVLADEGPEAFDAEAVSRLSAEIRAPLPPVRPAPRPVTLEGLARLEAEHARRKAGLGRAQATERACSHELPEGHVLSTDWLAAVKAIRAEIADYRARLAPPRPAPAVMLMIAGPVASVARDPDAIAETLAEAYAALEAWEIGGTVDAPEPAGPAGESVSLTTAHRPSVFSDLGNESDGADTTPGEAIGRDTPREAIGEAWGPTDATHPIVALCLSEAARVALHAAVMDGTAPAHGRAAKGGAWRISLADAQALQHIKSIRWAGMPRKPYTRRTEPVRTPLNAIVPPLNAIGPIPHPSAIIPGAGRMPCPVTFHAAP